MRTPTKQKDGIRSVPPAPSYPRQISKRLLAKTAADNISELYNGGALDSQITDSQFVNGLEAPDSPTPAARGPQLWSPPPEQTLYKSLLPAYDPEDTKTVWLRVTTREQELVMISRRIVNDKIDEIEASRKKAWLYAEGARKGRKWDKLWIDILKNELRDNEIDMPAFPVHDEKDWRMAESNSQCK
ncbi:hypothetical protein HWV62_40150 [Athelia sp. TMB]|nr:hypothetical protein HWV62_40150 [Athelia sp. TMB]